MDHDDSAGGYLDKQAEYLKYRMPVWFVHAEDDSAVPPHYSSETFEAIRRARDGA